MIKRIFYLLMTFLPFLAFSQDVQRCGTHEYWEQMKLNNPSLIEKEKKTNQQIQQWMAQHGSERRSGVNTVITIPVVVHVLWHNAAEDISDAQIHSQIAVLNEDFAKLNPDTSLVPAVWKPLIGNVQLEFCLAVRDPDGNPTTGIERRSTSRVEWTDISEMKFSASGGKDAWNSRHYLNIWVGNIQGPILGITQYPGGDTLTDGMCILYNAFGRVGTLLSTYNKGRTATHETGHWLGLNHIWGDSNCGDDNISDTPTQQTANYNCPAFPHKTCGNITNGDMFMNYMDYSPDQCMHMFTVEQATVMNATLNAMRPEMLNSPGCLPIGINEIDLKNFVNVYPNPAPSSLHIETHFKQSTSLEISIHDVLGNVLFGQQQKFITEDRLSLNVGHLANGLYMVTLKTPEAMTTVKVSVQR